METCKRYPMKIIEKDLSELGECNCFICGERPTTAMQVTAEDETVLIYPVCDLCLGNRQDQIVELINKDLAEHE